jgi:outer membrane biosynthesis protein TonB
VLRDLHGPEYYVVEQVPVFNNGLAKQALSKPDPMFPSESDAGGFGNTVHVSVIVDESGRVISAGSNTPISFLRDPAVEAAYQATFSPTFCNGHPVLSSGIVSYKHTPARLAKK